MMLLLIPVLLLMVSKKDFNLHIFAAMTVLINSVF